MAPFAQSNNLLKDRLETLRALHLGHYYVDVSQSIDRMAKRESKEEAVACSFAVPSATLGEIREAAIRSQHRIYDKVQSINDAAETVSTEAANLADIALCTTWRLMYDAAVACGFAVTGVIGIIAKKKAFSALSFVAALTSLYSFFDELGIRSDELNFEFDYVRRLCRSVAHELLDFSLLRENHNYFTEIFKERFGAAFTDGTDDIDELLETYDPDASPPSGLQTYL